MRKYMPLPRAPVLICLLFAWLPLLASTGGEAFKPPLFDHYQPILDRMPFGALPDNFNLNPQDAAASQLEAKTKAEQELLKKKIKMSVVNITPAGATAIGFTDLSVKPPVNHYLRVGESSAGWLVVSADYGTGSAMIEKDGVSVELSLQQAAAAAPAVANAEKGKPQEEPRNGKIFRRGSSGSPRHSFAKGVLPGVTAPGQMNPSMTDSAAEATPSSGQGKPATVSYADRLRARHTLKTREQLAAEAKMREQFEKLARETAAKEIQRREEEALQAAQAEAELAQPQLEAQQPTEAPLLPEPEPPPAALQEGNTE